MSFTSFPIPGGSEQERSSAGGTALFPLDSRTMLIHPGMTALSLPLPSGLTSPVARWATSLFQLESASLGISLLRWSDLQLLSAPRQFTQNPLAGFKKAHDRNTACSFPLALFSSRGQRTGTYWQDRLHAPAPSPSSLLCWLRVATWVFS